MASLAPAQPAISRLVRPPSAGWLIDYQRSIPINGVTYIVSGAAARLRDAGREDLTAASWSTHSFVDLVVYSDRILGQSVDHDGRAIDTFVIEAVT